MQEDNLTSAGAEVSKMDPLLKTALIRTLGLVLFSSVSPWLFVLVENTEENDVEEKYQLLRSLYESMAYKYNMSIEEFNNFSSLIYEALSEPKPQWDYFAALDFVYQAITTIGYGTITPHTSEGQLLCIFVSLIGIPITLLTLKSNGELMAKWINTVVTKFEKRILTRLEPKLVPAKSAVISFSFMLLLMIGNGLLLMRYLDLTFVEGIYFWFVTFTTIGFGDFVFIVHGPQSTKQLSLNNSINYITKADESKDVGKYFENIFFELLSLLSLCVVSCVLNSIMAAIDHEEHKCHSRCFGCVPRKIQEHVNNNQNEIPEEDGEISYLGMKNVGLQKETSSSL